MTAKERFERIEHVTAGLVEERRKDREEYRQLWRDTQGQINELTIKIAEVDEHLGRRIDSLGERIEQFAEASRAADERLRQSIEAVDKRLGDRIDSLVSAIGALAASTGKPNV
jgi:hypothetical protein